MIVLSPLNDPTAIPVNQPAMMAVPAPAMYLITTGSDHAIDGNAEAVNAMRIENAAPRVPYFGTKKKKENTNATS